MGKLILYYGVMGTSKTTSLMQQVYNLEKKRAEQIIKSKNKLKPLKIVLMKPEKDDKGKDEEGKDYFNSRIIGNFYRPVDVILPAELSVIEAFNQSNVNILDCDYIFLDEAQFITAQQALELFHISKNKKLKKLQIVCYSLKTDFQANFFPGNQVLFRYADEQHELVMRCEYCAEVIANFNARQVNGKFVTEGAQVVIDNQDSVAYYALCSYCFHESVLTNDQVNQQVTKELEQFEEKQSFVKKADS